MSQVGERVLAVIASRSIEFVGNRVTRTSNERPRQDLDAHALHDARSLAQLLVSEGFDLLYFHPVAISFSGLPETFERVFGFRPRARQFALGPGRKIDGYDVDPDDAHLLSDLPPAFKDLAGAMAIARPPSLINETAAPLRDVTSADLAPWSLSDELAISTWADGAVAPPATGHGVIVAQIGTGHYRHRFFSERGYRVLPTLLGPGASEPQRDNHGHGTGEAACLFGAAPDLRLRPVKGLLDPVGDLLMTIDSRPRPKLIVNSWGYDVDGMDWWNLKQADQNLFNYLKILEAAIGFATASGVVVLAATDKTKRSFPSIHPDVIAIAADNDSQQTLSSRSLADNKTLYPDRNLPDLWCDPTRSLRADLDPVGCTQPVQPGAFLDRPELQKASLDEGFAWCHIEQGSLPLAASHLALLLEQHRTLSPAAFKAMMTDVERAPMMAGLLPDTARAIDLETSLNAEEGMPKLAG